MSSSQGGAFRRTLTFHSYQRGGWGPGTRHQKHQMLNPTLYLYRFPGPRGPGPFTMKYWWTLGCFPTGREVPFRLQEFLDSYQQSHVPVEVEEWLDCFIKNPAEQLVPALESFLRAMETFDDLEEPVGYKLPEPSISSLLKPLQALEASVSMTIPPIALRTVMGDRNLRERACDSVHEYLVAVKRTGSTPHRRAGYVHLSLEDNDDVARRQGTASLLTTSTSSLSSSPARPTTLLHTVASASGVQSIAAASPTPSVPEPNAIAREFVSQATSSIPETTSDDERCLISMVTTFAEGAVKVKKYKEAADMLSNLLIFSHDDDVRAAVHANIASAHNLHGAYKDAEFHGRESALLRASPRGYSNWATAVAYQDDFERAESILQDALVECPKDDMLLHTQQQIAAVRASLPHHSKTVPLEYRGRRAHSPATQWERLEKGDGRGFNNAFDYIVFKHHQMASKLDPTSNHLGSVFNRTGELGQGITSTKSIELS